MQDEQITDGIKVIQSIKYWIEHTIIGFNFCPFAKREFEHKSIHYEVVDDHNKQEQLNKEFINIRFKN